ncbi:MAG: hypothetical protein MUE40_16045 [Anaerolineae bacterium]|nr:hypothetical protein [Anaerolineae bacterium]
MKMIPKATFQLIAFGLLALILAASVLWTHHETGLFPLVRDLLSSSGVLATVDNAALVRLTGGVLVFIGLALPWLGAMFILREYTTGMATLRDEKAALRGQPAPSGLETTPRQRKIGQGITGITLGILLIFANLLLLDAGGGLILWVCAAGVPVSLLMGGIWLAQGLALPKS